MLIVSQHRLFLFGGPRLECDGVPVKLQRRKSLALLIYLAVTGQPHQRESLAALLWPEADSQHARMNLRQAIRDLTQALPPATLNATGDQLRLPATNTLWVDVLAFRRLLDLCHTHGHPPDEPCVACAPLLAEAVALYHNDFMHGFTLADSAEFDDWQAVEASALQADLTRALARLVRYHQHDAEKALPFARQWAARDPLNELPHQALVQLYAQTGQQAAALRQYHDYARRLQAEMGLEPSAELRALQATLANPSARPAPQAAQPPPAPPPIRPRGYVPAPSTPFVGREAERALIQTLLADPARRLITLIGPGGIGKTRLALQAAAEATERFADGVFFIPLEAITSPEAMISAIGQALRFAPLEQEALRAQLHQYLAGKNALLVFDNFESLPEGAVVVHELLQNAAHVQVLATSREKLNLHGESVLILEGLDVPPTSTTPTEVRWEAYSALALFVNTAQRTRPSFAIAPADLPALIRIGHLVEGAPLGLVLAAGWVDTLSLPEIADELTQSLDFLETSARNVPARHRSLRAVFDSSWRLLEEPDRVVFMKLAVFLGSFTRAAAQAVAGATLGALRSLVSKSLLRFDPKAQRYQMHVLLRQYAEEKLLTSGVADLTAQAHCVYFSAILAQHEQAIKSGRNIPPILGELAADFENLRAAWLWAAHHRLYDHVGQFIEGLSLYFTHRNLWAEAEELFGLVRETMMPRTPEAAHPVWGHLLTYFYGTTPDRRVWLEQAIEIARRYHDHPGVARGNAELGWFSLKVGDYPAAIRSFAAALPHYRATSENYHVINLLRAQAIAYSTQGAWLEAMQAVQEALAMSRALEDKLRLAECLGTRGGIHGFMGAYAAAMSDLREAYALQRETGRWADVTVSNVMLGWLHILNGELTTGRQVAEEVLNAAHGPSLRELRGLGLIELGVVASLAGDAAQTRKFFEASRLILEAPDLKGWATAVNRSLLFISAWGPAVMACTLHNLPTARAALAETLAAPFTRASLAAQALCLPLVALVLAPQRPGLAVELLALAHTQTHSVMTWLTTWPEVQHSQHTLRHTLGETAFAAHWATGQTLDLAGLDLAALLVAHR